MKPILSTILWKVYSTWWPNKSISKITMIVSFHCLSISLLYLFVYCNLSISFLYLFVDCITMVHGRCFSPSTPASSTTKTGRHDIAEVLLKVSLNTINHKSINLIFTDNIISLYSFKSNTAYRIKYLRKYFKCMNININYKYINYT